MDPADHRAPTNIKIHQEISLSTSVQDTTTSLWKILRSLEGGYVIQMK